MVIGGFAGGVLRAKVDEWLESIDYQNSKELGRP
jgi:hypothetical protein